MRGYRTTRTNRSRVNLRKWFLYSQKMWEQSIFLIHWMMKNLRNWKFQRVSSFWGKKTANIHYMSRNADWNIHGAWSLRTSRRDAKASVLLTEINAHEIYSRCRNRRSPQFNIPKALIEYYDVSNAIPELKFSFITETIAKRPAM